MDDPKKQLAAYKAAASRYQSELQYASTKDEALTLAISVAENLMKAMKLATGAEEKAQLKSQCRSIMDVADRIKNTANWTPLATKVLPPMPKPKPKTISNSKNDEIGKWAADVAKSSPPISNVEVPPIPAVSNPAVRKTSNGLDLFPSSSVPRRVPGNVVPPNNFREASGDGITAAKSPAVEDRASQHDTVEPLIDFSTSQDTSRPATEVFRPALRGGAQLPATENTSQDPTIVKPKPTPVINFKSNNVEITQPNETPNGVQSSPVPRPPPEPAPASATHIHRLKEPISTRKRTKREDIVLLRASMVNGFKFPPWDKNPSAAEFVPEEGSAWFTDTPELSLSTYQQQFFGGWVRAEEALPPASQSANGTTGDGPLMSSPLPIDLVQDAATDCSVVASLCAGIARSERGHDRILSNKIWPYDSNRGKPVISPNGKYVVRLNFNGCWRKVVIDDRLPMSKTHRLLHVIDRHNPALLWPALLEKAYLKVRGGYDFPGSNSCSDLWTFTGWIPEEIYLQETETVPAQLWTRIYNAFSYGDVLVTLGTGKMSPKQEREVGLEGQHSYVVLDMKETDDDKLFLVKNPWVEGKGWRGPRPEVVPGTHTSTFDDSSKSRDAVPAGDFAHPTTFWIGLDQVIQHYERLYLNWNPGLFRFRQDIHFEWNIGNEQGGDICIVNQPQFSFSSQGTGTVWFLLSRHFRDAPETDESDAFNDGSVRSETHMYSSGEALKGYMSIWVCNGKGEQLYVKETYLECTPSVSTPQCLLRWDSDADETYTVVVDQEELPASTYTFSLSAFANSAISLERATQRYPHKRVETGSWTKLTAGGDTGSPKYFQNPQYTLEVREPTSLAILLTSTDEANPLNMKLALGYGKRIYRLQSRDVLADSGDYRSGCVYAETNDLQPGLYTIICSLFEAGKTGDFTLRVDSTSAVRLKAIPRDGAGLVSLKGTPACFGPTTHKLAAPLFPRRLAKYTIVSHFVKATSPRSHDLGKLARSPLRLSVEIGRGPERKFLITSEQGEYSDRAIVRSEAFDIDPAALFRGADVWLVLDRLSGPGGPIEEWYDVEIFTDMPNAFTIGVWREWND